MKIITIHGKKYRWNYKKTMVTGVLFAAVIGIFTFFNQGIEDAKVYEPEDSVIVQDLFPIPVIADVPLDAGLQEYIWGVAEDYGLDPKLVIAVIGQESNYQIRKIGDDGESTGLMQVQEKWHKDRMKRLDCIDLLDPYDNVLVGIDYLAECIEKGGLKWGLMCYNGGPEYANAKAAQGITTEYVEGILYLYETMGGAL